MRFHSTRAIASVVLALGALGVVRASPSISQTTAAPTGRVANVRFEQGAGGVIDIAYDLESADPGATFTIVLEVSLDGGQTFALRPRNVSGDVGPSVAAGPGKKIVWDAGQEIEIIQLDQIRMRLVPERGVSRATPTATGSLIIVTEPPGATVTIDGTPRGQTPLTVSDLPLGTHLVAMAKGGYLENRATVDITAGDAQRLTRTLSVSAGATAPSQQSTGGSRSKWLIPLLGGAGAAAAVGAAKAGGSGTPTSPSPPPSQSIPPPTASLTISPQGTVIVSITSLTFTAGSSPQSTFAWNFGDGTTGSGATVTHVYDREGTFTVSLTVSNGAGTAGANGTVTSRSLTGTWRPDFFNAFCFTVRMTQTGASIAATVSTNVPATVVVQSPRDVMLNIAASTQFGCGLHQSHGTFDATLDSFSAFLGSSSVQADTWRRQ